MGVADCFGLESACHHLGEPAVHTQRQPLVTTAPLPQHVLMSARFKCVLSPSLSHLLSSHLLSSPLHFLHAPLPLFVQVVCISASSAGAPT